MRHEAVPLSHTGSIGPAAGRPSPLAAKSVAAGGVECPKNRIAAAAIAATDPVPRVIARMSLRRAARAGASTAAGLSGGGSDMGTKWRTQLRSRRVRLPLSGLARRRQRRARRPVGRHREQRQPDQRQQPHGASVRRISARRAALALEGRAAAGVELGDLKAVEAACLHPEPSPADGGGDRKGEGIRENPGAPRAGRPGPASRRPRDSPSSSCGGRSSCSRKAR